MDMLCTKGMLVTLPVCAIDQNT